MYAEATEPFVDPGATVFDTLDGNISSLLHVKIYFTNSTSKYLVPAVNTWILGTYNITYDATNIRGLVALTVNRIVIVRDTTPPEVTVIGRPYMWTQGGVPYVDYGAVSLDRFDGNITSGITINISLFIPEGAVRSPLTPANLPLTGHLDALSVFAPLESVYTITYISRDRAGNVGTAMRQVTIRDTLSPFLTANGSPFMELRLGASFVDPGATSMDYYFGDMTSQIEHYIKPNDYFLNNITSELGLYLVYYTVTDPVGQNTEIQGRVIRVLDESPGSDASYSSVAIPFQWDITTPVVTSAPVAYMIEFSMQAGSLSDQVLAYANIVPSFIDCRSTSYLIYCTLEAALITAYQLQYVRVHPSTVSVSPAPIPISHYNGAFTTVLPVTPNPAISIVQLEEKGYHVRSITCSKGMCVFTTGNRPPTGSPLRRRRSGLEIRRIYLARSVSPLIKRQITFVVPEMVVPDVLVQITRLQPSSLQCADGSCSMYTYERITASQVTDLSDALSASFVSDPILFVQITGNFSVDTPLSDAEAELVLLENGVDYSSVSCDAAGLYCVFESFAANLPFNSYQLVDANGAVYNASLEMSQESPTPNLPYGSYKGALTAWASVSVREVFASLNIANITSVHCQSSAVMDNANDCTYISAFALSTEQLAALRNDAGIVSVSTLVSITLEGSFRDSLVDVMCKLLFNIV